MYKKLFLLSGLLMGLAGFSQKILTDSYQPPQTVQDHESVRMLPGFHANSNDGNYGSLSFTARIGDPGGSTNPPVMNNLSAGENYVYTRTYLAPVTASNDYAPQIRSVQYFDGLGRPKQVVNVKASPTGQDLVTTIPYDDFGRQVDSWLPAPMASLNGGIQSGVEGAAIGYYNNDQHPFSHKKLENSPLDRIETVTQLGDAWQNNPVRYEYLANSNNEVLKISPVTAWVDGASTTSSLKIESYYAASTLYKNKVSDEDGNISYEFKNGQGQTLMVRKMDGSTPVDTYYVYNEYDQLAFVISPLAAAELKKSPVQTRINLTVDPILNELCYQYKYDGQNRLVEKKLPGKGWEFMVYDKADRLILTQDANMRSTEKWLLTKYDTFGRVVYTGITPGSDRATMQDVIKDLVIFEERDGNGFTKNGMAVLYSKHFYTDMETVLSVNYYDTYPDGTLFPQGDEIQGVPILKDTFPAGISVSTQSLPVASYVKNIENDGWTRNYTFYDRKGRVIGNYSYNHLGGYTKTETELDFAGVPQKTYTRHQRHSTGAETVVKERFVYNPHNNALVKHYHEVVGKTPEELLADNTYNEIGQLITKKVGNNIQEINYTYNIRGWMTGINLDPTNNMQPGKLFNYRISYNNPEFPNVAAGRYNGNISEVDWKTNGSARKKYGYQYDSLNRLMNGIYQDPDDAFPRTDINSESIEYDLNGNITRLYRNTKHLKTYTARQIDNLTYYYENANNSNRLQKITDGSGNRSGYEGGGGIISYDDNGNMLTMPDKGITTPMAYNFLNLPSTIVQHGNTTSHLYRADGLKLKKVYTLVNSRGTTVINTEYLDGFQYSTPNADPLRRVLEEKDESTVNAATAGEEEAFIALEDRKIAPDNPTDQIRMVLSFFPTSEGYYDFENLRYIYQYKDHLGNVRVSYVKDGSSLKIMDTNDYYPYGMSHLSGSSILTPPVYDPLAIPYNYKYNGKELQETGMYDYGARFYMPDIGRWGVQDDHQELYRSYSSYHYVANNPILLIDPDGRDWYYTNDGQYLYDKALNRDNASQFFKDNNIEGAKYAFESNTMGSMNYAADGYIYDDSASGGGKPVENGKLHNIQEVTLTKNVALEKIIKTAIVGINMYSGYTETIGGIASLAVPEPTMLTKISGAYLIGDGATRLASGPFQIYGIWNNDKQLENVPSNLLGLVGNGIDNLNSNKPGYVTGGDGQLVGEMLGDFGLAKRSLYKALMSPQGVSKMKDYIRFGKIVNSLTSPARTGYNKGKKLQENEK